MRRPDPPSRELEKGHLGHPTLTGRTGLTAIMAYGHVADTQVRFYMHFRFPSYFSLATPRGLSVRSY